MLPGNVRTLLETPCGLIVGTIEADGAPYASRGWSMRFPEPDRDRARLVLAGDDVRLAAQLVPGAAIAVTGTEIRTLEGVQVKGTVVAVEAPNRTDLAVTETHTRRFFDAITEVDEVPRALLERMRPSSYVVAVVELAQAYVQTPGPGAGRAAR